MKKEEAQELRSWWPFKKTKEQEKEIDKALCEHKVTTEHWIAARPGEPEKVIKICSQCGEEVKNGFFGSIINLFKRSNRRNVS